MSARPLRRGARRASVSSHDVGQRWDTVIVWFRRDLRVHDHPALSHAVARARHVVPVFVLDERLLDGRWPSDNRAWFLVGSLYALDVQLRARGGRLILRTGPPELVIPRLAAEVGAGAVLVTRDVGPYARRRDRAVAAALAADGRSLLAQRGLLLAEPDELRTAAGAGYTVFSPFWRALQRIERRAILPAPSRIPVPLGIDAGSLPAARPAPAALPEAGEEAARRRLRAWTDQGVEFYHERRNDLAGGGTSRLSQDLHLGLLSVTEVEAACGGPGAGPEAFRRQLAWREFYHHLLWYRPELASAPFQQRFGSVFRSGAEEREAVTAWREGRTGVPVVDAGMRQLGATGWLPNRARLIVASFLTRHLLVDYHVGEDHFMRHLVDGDLANDNGGWQWTAGVGTDAQPWFRIFNPVLQGQRFDPDGTYVRRWVPELANIPDARIHHPWMMSPDEARAAGVVLGGDYPKPIIDLAEARARALAAFQAASG
jgi:deoxyribodipyrimidine photo-lyase